MSKSHLPNVCSDCKNWKCLDTSDHMEDEVGTCKVFGEIVYGDDESADSCEDFKSGKRKPRKRF